MIRLIFIVLCVARFPLSAQSDHPWADEPYLGLAVRDTEHGVVVGWVYPGPLGGRSFTSDAGIQRGDNIVSINATPIGSRDTFTDLISSLAPGDDITITYRRSPDADMNVSVPKGGEGGEETTLRVMLSSKDEWAGTVGRGLGERAIPLPRRGEYEQMIKEHAKSLGVMSPEDGLGALIEHIESVQDDAWDPNTLAHVAHAFQKPLALDGIAKTIDEQIAPIRSIGAEHKDADLETILGASLSVIDFKHDNLMEGVGSLRGGRPPMSSAKQLMRTMNESWSVDPARAEEQIGVIRWSMTWLALQMQQASNQLAEWETLEQTYANDAMLEDEAMNPDEWFKDDKPSLSGTVAGEIRAYSANGSNRLQLVVGGAEDNTYDMSRISQVVDLGGNDTYIWPDDEKIFRLAGSRHIIIDMGGNDTYRSATEFAGPGVGVFGGAIIDDYSGNDTYTSTKLASMATGLFGIGVILDRAGNDTYTNTGPDSGWSQGVGFYGIGLIIDREGRDVYHAEKLSQGVGGPRGFGAIIDGGGNDLYRANGPNYGSAYGTPGVYLGMSQGFGFGVRGYAAGGVGLIDDMSGNDQYIAGEFSQGGGYYFGLGMIRDHAGHDIYHANRYGQAFAAHQAAGILIDDAGDDTYWSMTAASQSGVWDESVTLLLDMAGNDSYRCDGLGIGAASMQAIGIFIDLEGDDRYSANGGATIGQSGSNTYHYDSSGVMSFSGFFDLGGTDSYSGNGRTNNT
ncbi:MAG: PDZ domain-containing protein, partial [bacterium]|nr:PDZ domain-containing protein [bacterium]